MGIFSTVRRVLADCCFFLGSVWAAAGVLKWTFGIRITFPIFPPLDLERVSIVPAIATGIGLFVVGAWLARSTKSGREQHELDAGSHPEMLNAPNNADAVASPAARRATPIGTRRPT